MVPGFFTPMSSIQRCRASSTTATPCGFRVSYIISAICQVRRSWICGWRQSWEKARRILDAALKEHPDVAQLHFNMSIVLEKLGSYGEALEHLREAARLDSFHPPASEHFMRLMRKAGENRPEK